MDDKNLRSQLEELFSNLEEPIGVEEGRPAFLEDTVEVLTGRKRAEEEIRRLSQFQESVIDSANVWLDVLDEKGNVLIWNKAAEEISGYSREEVVGHDKIWEWLYPNEEYRSEIVARAMARIEEGREERDVETTIRCKDGQTRVISWSSRTLLDEKGNSVGSIALGHDITERKQAEEALRVSEERFALAVRGSNDGIYDHDIANNTIYWSPRLNEILGYADDELALDLDTFDSLLHPDDKEPTMAALEAHLKDRLPYDLEHRLRTKSGEYRWVRTRGQAIWGEDGNAVRVVGSTTDITERKRAEEELRQYREHLEEMVEERTAELRRTNERLEQEIAERKAVEEALRASEERFALAVRGTNDGLWDWDIANDTLYWSPRYKELLGYAADELEAVFDTFESHLHPDDRERIGAAIEAHLKDRVPYDVEERARTKSGEYRWFRARGQALWDEAENPVRMAGSITDITERKRAEEEIRRLNQFLDAVIESANVWLDVLDEKGNVVLRNRAAEEISGYSREEVVGHNKIWEWLYPDEEYRNGIAARAMARIEKGGEDRDVETTIRRKDGQTRIISWNTRTLLDGEGNPIGSVALGHDITERKRTEEALRENEERFRLTVEATRDGLWENSFDHKRDFFSDRMFTMLGYEPMDPVNAFDFFNSLLHPDDVSDFEEKYNAMNRPGHDDYSVGIRFKAKDDTWRHILSRGKCVERDDKGRAVRIVGTHTDITDLKRAEEALRKAHEELERYTADLERRTAQLQAAAEVSRATTSVLDPDELLRQVVDLVRERFDLYYVGLFLPDEERQFAILRAGTGEAGRKMLEAGHKLEVGGESMIGWCLANAQARIALDVGEEAVRFSNPLLPETRSEMALPLVSRGQAIGAMTVQSNRAAAFSEEDITVLQTMADQLANAIENARLFEDTKSRLAQVTALQETSRAVTSTLELDKLLNLITRQATTLLQGDGGLINLVNWEKMEDEVVAACGSQAPYLGFPGPLEGSLSGWVILHNQPVISNQLQDDDRVHRRVRSGDVQVENAAIAPLTVRDQVIGSLVVNNKQGGFDQADLGLLLAFANQAATAIENARLYEELTGELAERKAVEEALRASEERFALAVQGSRDGLWDWDIANNTLYWSPRMKELLGYADDELDVDFDTLTSHLHPDDMELTNVAIEAHLQDRVPYDLEHRLCTKSGEYRWVQTRGQAVWDETGQPIRMVGSSTDITERKQAEEALRESEERFRLTVEATRDGLWENSLDHKRDFFSDRMFTMLGYEPMDPVNAFDFFNSLRHPDDVSNFEEKYNAINEPGHDDYSVEIRYKAKDGTWRHILSRGKCVERDDKGRAVRIVGTHTDITDLKRAQETLERRALQLQTASEVSRAASSILAPGELIQQVVDLVRERFDLYYVGLFLPDEERQFAILRAGTGEAGRKMLEAGHKLEMGGESMIGWCIANAQARIALDVGEEAVRFSNPLLPETRSEMALPLVSRGQVIGAMTVQSNRAAAFSEEDITVLQTMADQLANAIENARLFEDTKRRLAQVSALQETTRAMASTLELDKLLNLITRQATTLLQGDGGLINLVDREKMEDEVVTACGSQAPYVGSRGPLEGSLSGWVTLHNQPIISNQLQDDDRVDRRVRSGEVQAHNAAVAPLTVRDQVMGSLVVNNKQGGFDQSDLDLLLAFANQAATAIENARLFEQTQQTSFLLGERVRELACLNDIGRKIDESPPIPEFLQWMAASIPRAMRYSDVCLAAVELEGQVYGAAEAVSLPCQMVQALRVGGEVIGRIYIAYTERHDFLDEESALLGDIVRRVSGYIESRRLFEQTQAALAEIEATHRLYLREQWAEYVPARVAPSYERTQPGVTPLGDAMLPEVEQVMARREMVVQSSTGDGAGQAPSTGSGQAVLVTPISLRGEVIGALGLHETETKRRWTDDEIALIEAVAEQMALAIENARLFEQTQRRAAYEKLLADITTRVRSSMDPQTILQTAVRELGAALGTDRAFVRLGVGTTTDEPMTNDQ